MYAKADSSGADISSFAINNSDFSSNAVSLRTLGKVSSVY